MPPTKEMIERALEKLESLELIYFTAAPPIIRPGHVSTLAWKIKTAKPQPGVGVQYRINGIKVKGTALTVSPLVNTVYTLTAESTTIAVSLGSVAVNIDTTGCIEGTKPEAEVRTEVTNSLSAFIKQHKVPFFMDLEQLPTIEIDYSGINIVARLGITGLLPFTIFIRVSMRITLGAQNGEAKVSCAQFNASVDYPGLLDFLIPPQVQDNVDSLISTLIEGPLKDDVVDNIKEKIESDPGFQLAKLAGYRLVVLRTVQDAVAYMVCQEQD